MTHRCLRSIPVFNSLFLSALDGALNGSRFQLFDPDVSPQCSQKLISRPWYFRFDNHIAQSAICVFLTTRVFNLS